MVVICSQHSVHPQKEEHCYNIIRRKYRAFHAGGHVGIGLSGSKRTVQHLMYMDFGFQRCAPDRSGQGGLVGSETDARKDAAMTRSAASRG